LHLAGSEGRLPGLKDKMKKSRLASVLASAAWLCLLESAAVSGAEQAPEPTITLPPELARVLTDYEEAWQAGDEKALAALFTEDGFVLSTGMPPVRGRRRIEERYRNSGGPLALRAVAYATEGNLGYIIGGYSRSLGEPDIGKFTLTLRKEPAGRWLIMSDMDNGNRRRVQRIEALRNPVIPGFHPDPSVVRVGETFYLVNSSFEFFPGVPIHRSRDLVHWEPVGHVLTRDSQLPLEGLGPSLGIFAPTIRYHDGTYYMITTLVGGDGNFFVTASDPKGEWSEPIWIRGQGGIDPSLFFDDDDRVYLTTTGGKPDEPGESGIYVSRIDPATGELLTEPSLAWKGTGGRYPEGPHLYKVGGRYYLLISEGGTEYGHMVTIARSERPTGPFEACPRNPILTHRDTHLDQPIQGTGHPDLVQDAEGNWWMVFLAFRPQGGYFHHLGRETFLAPVRWDGEGWPVVNDGRTIALEMQVRGLPARPVPRAPERDTFEGALGPLWNHLRNPLPASYSTAERKGWLTLHGSALTLATTTSSPTFVGRRQQHLNTRVATRLDFAPVRDGEEAGMVLYRHPFHRYELGVRRVAGAREVFVRQTIGESLSTITASAPLPGDAPVELRIDANPREYTLSYSQGGSGMRKLDLAQARFLSSEVAGGFVGTYVGLYATGNGEPATAPAAFDWFDYEPARND
jgi:alpha-N-arabinofuranosidase